MADLKLHLLVGHESKKWLQDMEALISRLEKALGNKTAPAAEEEPETVDTAGTEEETEDDEDFAPKKKAKAKSKSFEDDEEETESEDEESEDEKSEDDDEDVEEEKPKRGRPPKKKDLTDDDVNQACKERVARLVEEGMEQKEARADVLTLLKKKFKVKTVAELDPDQYEAVIKVMNK